MVVKSKSETAHLKLSREVYEQVRKIADGEQRSINNTLRVLVDEALKARAAK